MYKKFNIISRVVSDNMMPVQIRFTRKLIERIDELIDSGIYSNRSEAIRDATRRLVIEFSQRGVKSKGKSDS